jgi:hypothetical protein
MLPSGMFGPRPTLPRPRSLHSNRCHPERSEGSWLVLPLAPTAPFEQSLLCRRPLFLAVGCELSTINCHPPSPFPATLTSRPQPAENKTTSSPAVAILDAASSITPLFATLTKNTRGWGTSANFLCVSSASLRCLFLSSTAVSCKLSTGNS